MKAHKQVLVKLPGKRNKVSVDKELVPLVMELNRQGLVTADCCEGYGRHGAYLGFFMKDIQELYVRKNYFSIQWKRKRRGN